MTKYKHPYAIVQDKGFGDLEKVILTWEDMGYVEMLTKIEHLRTLRSGHGYTLEKRYPELSEPLKGSLNTAHKRMWYRRGVQDARLCRKENHIEVLLAAQANYYLPGHFSDAERYYRVGYRRVKPKHPAQGELA